MFTFTTTTVINSLTDLTTKEDLIIKNEETGDLLIKRVGPFKKVNVTSVAYKPPVDPANDTVTIAGVVNQAADKKIELYVRSTGNADPLFANAMLHKGAPIFIEIPAQVTAEALKSLVMKHFSDMKVEVEVSGSDLVITCTNPFQRITKAVVSTRDDKGNFSGAVDAAVTVGDEGFGDYDHLMKDLRLPTSANLRWKRTMEDEMPVAGAKYHQYIVTYTVERGVMGLGAVGSVATSVTTHVFWVNDAVNAGFKDKTGWGTDSANILED